MFHLKFIVLLFQFSPLFCLEVNYCEICYNHTLCKYKISGPGSSCLGYDRSALLTQHDIRTIVNRINDRRKLVASGRARNEALPPAANMMKLSWSEELATIAQRWVDQCDPELQPDRRDYCRDLVNEKVGQNIATVMGLSPGLGVNSFVDIWFMQAMDYSGSVSYYNQSSDESTDYFTQLIWADTSSVGCGRAKFFIRGRMPVDRLVCNFAPKGNIHSQPVFNIGFPATQCPEGSSPDLTYAGLCALSQQNTQKATKSTASHLLKILNLTNNNVTQGIDPIHNNLENHGTVKPNRNQRNQKTRHVFNRTYSVISPGIYPANDRWGSRRVNHQKMQRIHHTYEDKTDAFYTSMKTDNGNFFGKCTRHRRPAYDGLVTDKCTKGQEGESTQTLRTPTKPQPTNRQTITLPTCSCYTSKRQATTTTATTHCTCDQNCQCLNEDKSYFPTRYPSILRIQDNDMVQRQKVSDNYFYSSFPVQTVQNINHETGARPGNILSKSHVDSNDERYSADDYLLNDEHSHRHVQQNVATGNVRIVNVEHPRPQKSLYLKYRHKRDSKDKPLQPFWLSEGFKPKQAAEVKSLLYTTLINKRTLRNNRPAMITKITNTEPITLKHRESSRTNEQRQQKPVKEKYLSFDELMSLRRHNEDDELDDVERRRINPDRRTAAASTTVVELNTYPRIKHCTRKLTCTWTAPTVSGGKGLLIQPGGGSRTPPGYVDGCTRTSTCSRMYMDRNLQPTNKPAEDSDTTDEDVEYCERRSLNIKRRDFNSDKETENENFDVEIYSESSIPTESYGDLAISNVKHITKQIDSSKDVLNNDEEDCGCNSEKAQRKKRKTISADKPFEKAESDIGSTNKNLITYGNVYYSVVNKIFELLNNKDSQTQHVCACGCSDLCLFCRKIMVATLIFNLLLNY